jgi:sporulation protein YlmC with PRC-barrel domain
MAAGGARSKEVGDEEGSGVRWIRSYVLQEDDGTLGTYCIYEAESPEAIRAHAEKAGFGADEINAIADTVIIRPDPVKEPAAS